MASPLKPERIQLHRTKGFRLPPTGRSVAYPSPFANPFRPATRTYPANLLAVTQFEAWLHIQPDLVTRARHDLKTCAYLACWCSPDLPCHADIWCEILSLSETDLHLWESGEMPLTSRISSTH